MYVSTAVDLVMLFGNRKKYKSRGHFKYTISRSVLKLHDNLCFIQNAKCKIPNENIMSNCIYLQKFKWDKLVEITKKRCNVSRS